MPPRRLAPLDDVVTLEVDGKPLSAARGEPVAVALAAAGRLTLGRSVKYHRPRGAACYAGRCDGCLMRVDGVPSVMTCRTPAQDGLRVETQNVLGSAKVDLLAATDWFFPGGMNHHEMFTWNESVNRVMQKIARRVAGIGQLPDAARPPVEASEVACDVLVIGAGPAGLAAAAAHGEAGHDVHVVDEEPRPGGSLRWWPGPVRYRGAAHAPSDLADALLEAADAVGVTRHAGASAVAVFAPREDVPGDVDDAGERRVVLVDAPEGVRRFYPHRLVFAVGRQHAVPAFSDSDTPGVVDLPAAGRLLAHGVLPGEEVLLAGEGEGVTALAEALRARGGGVQGPFPIDTLRDVIGRPSVAGCALRLDGKRRRLDCDAIVVDGPSSAAYELPAQAGVATRWAGEGFELEVDPRDGASAVEDTWVVGGAAGAGSLDAVVDQATASVAAPRRPA